MYGPETSVACPKCGAKGNEPCSTAKGNDHLARLRAEIALLAPTEDLRTERPVSRTIVLRLTQTEARNLDDALVKYEHWIITGTDPEDLADQATVERIRQKMSRAGYDRQRALRADTV